MEATEKTYKRYTILRVSGRVDAETAPNLEKQINKAFSKGQHHLVVDLGGVDYISSAGLGVLLKTQKRLREKGGGLVLTQMKKLVRDVFRIARFDLVFEITSEQ